MKTEKNLSKLPDWLTARWNRQVIEIEEATNQFPSFSQFVKFLTREVKIACNPLTSLQALKQDEAEKNKSSRHFNLAAKTLITSSSEKNADTSFLQKDWAYIAPMQEVCGESS